MASSTPDKFSPGYRAFHLWLRDHRARIKAGKDRTVIYSGLTKGNAPVWQELDRFERILQKLLGRKIGWRPIELVLRHLNCGFGDYAKLVELPEGMLKAGHMWDFACSAERYVTAQEKQQIWKNLSAWYVKNAQGEVYLFKGHFLKQYPDFLLAEIPVLAKNGKISEATMQKVFKLIPESEALWNRYRDDTPENRTQGR